MTVCFLTVLSVVFWSVLLGGWLHCCAVANQVVDVRGKTLSRRVTDKGMAYAKFKAHKFSYLNITSIGSDNVLKGSECGLACVKIPSCFSFNLAAFHDINGKVLCELLPSDMYNNSEQFGASHVHHHFSITSPCISWPCQNKGTCAAQYEKNSYVCVCAKGYTGKQCETGNFGNSAILSNNSFFISTLLEFLAPAVGNDSLWLLCYRASTHGWAVSNFHTRCDGKYNTVTIIKNDQYVFGGYTDIPWESPQSDSYSTTSNAFIFSLRNKEELKPFKSMVLKPSRAIYRYSGYGPTFGYAYDIRIADNANSNSDSYSDFGEYGDYAVPDGVNSSFTILAGTNFFSPDDWEVFYLG